MESVMAMPRDDWSLARDLPSRAAASTALEFGRFRVLLRQRQLVADGAPIELGTRAFDILLVLLEAAGSLVTKDELLRRVWPDVVVVEGSVKVQICALRKALGEDQDFIRTEFGRGYRFTAAVRSTVACGACQCPTRRRRRSTQSCSCRPLYRVWPKHPRKIISFSDHVRVGVNPRPESMKMNREMCDEDHNPVGLVESDDAFFDRQVAVNLKGPSMGCERVHAGCDPEAGSSICRAA
jgi:DNA-binding winged helix-turn-helix (wHTH) protein